MKKTFCYALATAVLAITLGAANASPPIAHNLKMTAKPAVVTTVAKPAIPDYKLPYTFVCKHCGIKITVKTPADWLKVCPACPCGTNVMACLPDKKK